MRLTEKKNGHYYLDLNANKSFPDMRDKLGQFEDIEEELGKLTFYGKILQYPNELMELRFLRIYFGGESTTDIRIEFEVKKGFGNVFYHIFDYGKMWALRKEELL